MKEVDESPPISRGLADVITWAKNCYGSSLAPDCKSPPILAEPLAMAIGCVETTMAAITV